MAVRGRRASRLLAHHTQEVSRHTKGGETSLMDLIERDLARRAEHVAAIAVIDGELGRVYDRLGQDRPAYVPPSPSPVRPSPEAGPVAPPRVSVATPPSPAVAASSTPRTTTPGAAVQAVVARVLSLVRAGQHAPKDIYASLDADLSRETVKRALAVCVADGRLVRTGATVATRYELAPPPAPPPAAVRRAVVDDGVEFEPVWTGAKSDASLLGERSSRGSSLARV